AGREVLGRGRNKEEGGEQGRDHQPRQHAGGIERATDSSAAAPYTIIGMLGGMITSIAPTAVMRPAMNVSGDPARRISGTMTLPMVAPVAPLAPEIARKIPGVAT